MGQLFKDKDPDQVAVARRPPWMSPDLWDTLVALMDEGQLEVLVRFTDAERKIVRKPKPVKASEWAEKHRVLTYSVLPGRWHNSVTPYGVGIMDAAILPFVHEVTICATPQTGKSEIVHNIVGYCIDRDPGPALYTYPDERTADDNSRDRILPMIQSSTRLSSYFTGSERDKGLNRINLSHMPIYLSWGRSVASIANKPIKIGVADEIDKKGFDTGIRETSVLKLIDKRFTTYRGSYKFFKISSPTLEEGRIWVELQKCQVVFDFWVICPLCGQRQLMAFSNGKLKGGPLRPGGIRWEGGHGADPVEVKTRNLAWYECEHCQGRWDERIRDRAARAGTWLSRGKRIELMTYLETFRPSDIGFHIPSWISHFVHFGEIAAAFLEGLDDQEAMQDFKNGFCALPWVVKRLSSSEERVLEAKNDLPGGVVPADAIALTAGIDVQKRGFWFAVRAWNRNKDSHLVQYGYLSTWEDVHTLVYGTAWPVEGRDPKRPMGLWRVAMDTGGGETDDGDWSKTEEIYAWIKQFGKNRVFAVKGASRTQEATVRKTTVGMKHKGRPVPGALDLYMLDTDKLKRAFLSHFNIEDPKEEGGDRDEALEDMGMKRTVSLHGDTGMDYARQILAEEERADPKTKKLVFVQVRHDNHLLDCEVYAAAAADDFWAPALIHTRIRRKKKRRAGKVGKGGFVNSWR